MESFSSRLYQDNTFVVSPTLSSCVYLLPVPQEAEERAENAAWEYSSVLPSHSSRKHREVSTGWRCSWCGKEVRREGTRIWCTWCVLGPSFMCLAPVILQNLAMILLPPLPRWRSCGGPENVGSLSKIKQYTNYSPPKQSVVMAVPPCLLGSTLWTPVDARIKANTSPIWMVCSSTYVDLLIEHSKRWKTITVKYAAMKSYLKLTDCLFTESST